MFTSNNVILGRNHFSKIVICVQIIQCQYNIPHILYLNVKVAIFRNSLMYRCCCFVARYFLEEVSDSLVSTVSPCSL
jgi:hypothetical protein